VVTEVANVIAAAAGFLAILGFIWIAMRGDPARDREDAARAFYDEHGHWPDEEPGHGTPAP
jgi:hypothetical protein